MNRNTLLWVIVGILALAGLGTGVYKMTRGIRNNNPGNIRRGPSQWVGMSQTQTDPDFVQFTDAKFGIRAIAKLLKNYQAQGLLTIRELINKWAPPNENLTESYVDPVAREVGVNPDSQILVTDHLVPLVTTIIKHENGVNPYSAETIAEGISLA